jgi:predicted O-methyltransferase YrrM
MQSNHDDIAALLHLVKEHGLTRVVEVGTWTGATAVKLADVGCSVTCIDWFRGQEDPADHIGHGKTFDQMYGAFRENTFPHLWRNIFPIVAQTTGAEWVQGPFDLAFIDADHRYENCRADIRRWEPCVRQGGIVACHDYSDSFPGVVKAVNEHRNGTHKLVANSLAWWVVE